MAIENGATISMGNKLADCVFENGSGNSYLRVSNSQALGTINNVTFGGGGSTPTHNIIYDGSGSVLFNNYKGSMAGARFEDDNGSDPVGNVRWTFNENQSVSASNTYTFGNDLDITVNTAGTLTAINVQLVDAPFAGYSGVYARNYVITTTPAAASGYDVDLLSYYADGTNNSSNEIPVGEDDTSPYLWVNSTGQNFGPYRSSNSTAQNWVSYTNITNRLADTWFVSNAETDESLPVELSTYQVLATEEGVELSWITESEINNLKWKLLRKKSEKSESEEETELIAEIEGMGTISIQTAYTYLDENIEVGTTYEYTLVSVSYNGHEVEEGSISVTTLMPEKFELAQNYPNPFNAGTTIKFTIPSTEHVEIFIYNALGQKVQTVVDEKLDAGFYTYRWDGTNLNQNAVASGVYFYILRSKDIHLVKKMVYLK